MSAQQLDESGLSQHQAERLKAENRQFSGILHACYFPVWQRDSQLKMTYCNHAFSELAEPLAMEAEDLNDIELFPGHKDLAEKALESGDIQMLDRHLIQDGQRVLYRITEVPGRDQTVNGFAVSLEEAQNAREELQRHVTAQKDFLETTANAMAIFGPDQRLKFYNFGYVALWKLDEVFLDQQPGFGDIFERLREARRLPEQSNFLAFKKQQLRYFTELIEPHEEFYYLPDGKTLRVIIVPHALGGLLFAYEDVTDRLALERSYNTLIAVQRETLDHLNEAVVVVGEDGLVKLSNPKFASMWSVEESALNHDPHIRDVLELMRHFYQVEDWGEFKEFFVAQLQQRHFQESNVELNDGRVLECRSIPLPDGGTLLAYTDITDSIVVERSLREKNDALEAADKLKSEFLANMSYELRSPLTSISGFSDILRNEYFGELTPKQKEYMEGIHQSSQQLTALINNILDLASIEAGYMQLEISEFDIYQMLESVLQLLQQRVLAMDITLLNDCSEQIGTMHADETRIRQVLFNLLHNAIKYTHRGGKITVHTHVENEHVFIGVEDEGVGIEESMQAHVFERFFRAGASRGQQSGSGLGLSIVKSFIELHGGHVSVKSATGQGAYIECMLPRVTQQS